MSKTLIAPSILAADFGNLQRDVEMINQSDAHWFHLDVMDGVFVQISHLVCQLLILLQSMHQKP